MARVSAGPRATGRDSRKQGKGLAAPWGSWEGKGVACIEQVEWVRGEGGLQ